MIGKKPLPIPEGVTVEIEKGVASTPIVVHVSSPKGKLSVDLPQGIQIKVRGEEILFDKKQDVTAKVFGLGFALVRNAVEGVAHGFSKELELVGVGYRAAKTADGLKLSLGFSHPVEFKIPEGVSVEIEKDTKIRLSGIDKQLVTQTAANIRKLKPPEPYKGKGIRYAGEIVRRKLGKAAKAMGGIT